MLPTHRLLFHHLTKKLYREKTIFTSFLMYWYYCFGPWGMDCKAVISYAHILQEPAFLVLFCCFVLLSFFRHVWCKRLNALLEKWKRPQVRYKKMPSDKWATPKLCCCTFVPRPASNPRTGPRIWKAHAELLHIYAPGRLNTTDRSANINSSTFPNQCYKVLHNQTRKGTKAENI